MSLSKALRHQADFHNNEARSTNFDKTSYTDIH